MPESGKDIVKQQTTDEIERIYDISMQIRRAVRAALPAPPEQFFTLMVPGKVVNFDDFTAGMDQNGTATTIVKPIAVQLQEAILVDDMPPLSPIALGPTGRSVARSYSATLSKLCPANTTIGIDDKAQLANPSEEERRYTEAMDWLCTPDAKGNGQPRIALYREKQTAYTRAVEDKTKAFKDQLDLAMKDPRNVGLAAQQEAYNSWVQQHERTYRNYIQAAYMDWVTIGKKEQVEYYFAIVDNDSAMARVEASKEAMRNTQVADSDGAAEYNTVHLTPSNWAIIAKNKVLAPVTGDTPDALRYQINRLNRLILALYAVQKDNALIPTYSDDVPQAPANAKPEDDPLYSSLTAVLTKSRTRFDKIKAIEAKKKNPGSEPKTLDQLSKELDQSSDDLDKERQALNDAYTTSDRLAVQASVDTAAQKVKEGLKDASFIPDLILQYNNQLKSLQDRLDTSLKSSAVSPNETIETQLSEIADVPAPPSTTSNADPTAGYWTEINMEVSSGYQATQSQSSANSFSAGGGAGWGLWSVGGSVSHSDATADAAKQMANSRVSVSFKCMRVDITRSWLRNELFYDSDLKVPDTAYISPGPVVLSYLMDPDHYALPNNYTVTRNGKNIAVPSPRDSDKQKVEDLLADYQLFPMYPTAFLLAADVVLEIEGETADIQSHFHTSTTSASASVGWGPFSVSASWSHTETQASATCETTATGCRIKLNNPQIIGWINEIIPALPRLVKQKE